MLIVNNGEVTSTVTHIDFDEVLQNRISLILELLAKKASEYAGDEDRLHNFEAATAIMAAAGFETSREREIVSMAMKHIVSVLDLVRKTMHGTTISKEMISEKIGDTINYSSFWRRVFMQSRNVLQAATRVRDPRENRCPICDGPAIKQCSCYHKDSCCTNGHSWHTCIVHRRIVARKLPGHGMIGCTCEVVKVSVP